MSKLSRNLLLLFKIQPTIDTDPIPTAGANAILAGNFTINAIQAQFADRENLQPYFGNSGKVQISAYSTVSFDVELASSGVAGTPPKFGPLLRSCAMAETIVASTSVAYHPVTIGDEMATLYMYLDGLLFKMLNSKGTVSFSVGAGGIPKMTYTFTGSFSNPADAALPSGVDYSGFTAPLGINKVNTPSLTIHGAAVKADTLSIDLANNVIYRNLIATESIKITDRSPSGQTSFETESVAFKDWTAIVRLGTLGPLELVHGTVAGRIVEIDAPKVQLTEPTLTDSDGISMSNYNLTLQPDTGNDELVVTFR